MSEGSIQFGIPPRAGSVLETAESIRYEVTPIQKEHVVAFCGATQTHHFRSIPPTFATCYRWAEFAWLRRLNIPLERLLHTSQEYEYGDPLQLGDTVRVTTRLASLKERRGMQFLTLETDIEARGARCVKVRTAFVVRGPLSAGA